MEQNEATDDEGNLTFTLLPRFILKSICLCAGGYMVFVYNSLGTYFLVKSKPSAHYVFIVSSSELLVLEQLFLQI